MLNWLSLVNVLPRWFRAWFVCSFFTQSVKSDFLSDHWAQNTFTFLGVHGQLLLTSVRKQNW